MSQAQRVLIVAASLLCLAVMAGPDLRRVAGHPLGIPNVSIDYHGVVESTGAGQQPPVRAGDRIDLRRAGPDQRFGYATYNTANAGDRGYAALVRRGHGFLATVMTHAEAPQRIAMVWLRVLFQLCVSVLASIVVLRRPSVATWGFFFMMLVGLAPINDVYLLGPQWWRRTGYFLYWQCDVLPQWGGVFFALHLLHDGPLPRWRAIAQTFAIVFVCGTCAAMLWHAWALLYWNRPDVIGSLAFITLSTLPLFAAPLLLIATYSESNAVVRARLRWIIGGFLVSVACNIADLLGSQGNLGIIQESYVTHSLLVCGTYVPIAIPVAYAILKHHIIDVNVAISRATVYTMLSVGIVGAFALVDMLFARVLEARSAGLMADVALALILGFSFNTMHRRMDAFVDRILFYKRHVAEEYVARLATAMTYTHSKEQVCSMLVHEPVRAFQLTGAKMYHVGDARADGLATLAACLEAERKAVHLSTGEWDTHAFFSESWVPATALPLFSHSTLDAAVVYGFHRDGTDLDRDEIALLEELATAAGAAFDRLEAEELRSENARLRSQLTVSL